MADNPLRAGSRLTQLPDPSIMVIFGASGDLAYKEIFPALYELTRRGELWDERLDGQVALQLFVAPAEHDCVATAADLVAHRVMRSQRISDLFRQLDEIVHPNRRPQQLVATRATEGVVGREAAAFSAETGHGSCPLSGVRYPQQAAGR